MTDDSKIKARNRITTIAIDAEVIINELIELGQIALRPTTLRLDGMERVGITERARRALRHVFG